MSPAGLTRDAGWQIGVRRTVAADPRDVWRVLRSAEGLRVWLGGEIELSAGTAYRLADGTEGEVRVDEPGSHLRVTWRPPGWGRASLIQVRVLPAARGATLAFHQEHLPDEAARGAMRERWLGVIERLRPLLDRPPEGS
ncbi:MAG: SRPBCC domain-containing protein [Thermoleophilia bacterium]